MELFWYTANRRALPCESVSIDVPQGIDANVHAYLTMKIGSRAGSNYLLDPKIENRIGRGLDCQIMLNDPLSSRVHAVITRDEDGWWVRDAGSRNGTFLNGQRIDDARLVDGCEIQVGHAEFAFRLDSAQPANTLRKDVTLTQTVVLDAPLRPGDTGAFAAVALGDEEHAKDLLDLYQLSLTLLGAETQEEVIATSLELLHQKSKAAVIAFLWSDDQGKLRLQHLYPAGAESEVELSDTLTEMVCQQGRAVWISEQTVGLITESLQHYADAICVPLLREADRQ